MSYKVLKENQYRYIVICIMFFSQSINAIFSHFSQKINSIYSPYRYYGWNEKENKLIYDKVKFENNYNYRKEVKKKLEAYINNGLDIRHYLYFFNNLTSQVVREQPFYEKRDFILMRVAYRVATKKISSINYR